MMVRFLRTTLSRRKFLAGAGTLVAGLLAACGRGSADDDQQALETTPEPTEPEEQPSPDPEPTATAEAEETTPVPTSTPEPTATPEPPQSVQFWIDPELGGQEIALVDRIVDRVQKVLEDDGIELVMADDRANTDLAILLPDHSDPDATIVRGEALIPVTTPDQLAPGVTRDQVLELFDGTVTNWIDLDGQDRGVTIASHPSAQLSGFPGDLLTHTAEDVAIAAAENPGLIAMVPRSIASIHVQSLIVDDIDPLRDDLSPEQWPWWEEVSVDLSNGADATVRQQLIDTFEDINDESHASRRTMMSVVGDVMLGRTVHTIMTEQNDWRAPYPLVADELQRGDLTIGNLECAITDSFEQPTYTNPRTFSFMSYTDAVDGLQYAGFHALSGANNHAMDFGIVGMRDTTAALEAAGIKHFGIGENLEDSRQPCLLEHDGVTFALLGYDSISMAYAGATAESGGVAPMIREYVEEDIRRAREQADVVIPYFHWGVEYTLTPTEGDRAMAHAAVDAGADLVLGGHPHWVQGMEIYGGTAIFYSLSNFVFDQEWSLETKQGFVLHLIFDRARFVGYRVVPVLIEDYHRPRIVEDDTRATILGRYWESTSIVAGS